MSATLVTKPARLTRAALVVAAMATAIAAQAAPGYSRDVRPILSEKCFACHGPDEAGREADLRLDVAGHGRTRELIQRITATERSEVMPPPHSGKTLSKAEIATLTEWVEAGTPYETHWAFVRPERVEVADGADAGASAIDRLVRARQREHGLQPAPEADRVTLARRLYLDLTGLPPTPAQADAFVQDRAPGAYERLVDELIASPHYAERQARRWLDLARYADSNGYEKDRPRSIWPYRDWVIRAFEARMPFDEFVVRQLAGDMLPDATAEDRIATGFHRNTMLNEEGGIDPLEFRFHALTDRVATTGSVFLGLTIGCAQCHTHKYDPITHREYFGLMAYFDDADEPDLLVPDAAADRRLAANRDQARRQLDALWRSWPEDAEPRDRRFAQWLGERRAQAAAWTPAPVARASSNLPTLTTDRDHPGVVVATGDTSKHDTYDLALAPLATTVTAIRIEALPDDALPAGGPGLTYYEGRKGDFFLSEFVAHVDEGDGRRRAKVARASESFAKNQYGSHPANAAAAIDGDLQTGWSTHTRNGERHVAVFVLAAPIPAGAGVTLELHFGRHFASSLGRLRISVTDRDGGADAMALAFDDDGAVEALLHVPDGELDEAQRRQLRDAFLLEAAEVAEGAGKVRRLRRRVEHASTLVMQERPAARGRVTRRHHRGEFLQPKEPVEPMLPAALGATQRPRNRLELARWLVSRDNPLAGRVVVNREWAAFFGRGLVATPGDFGAQGAAPSHPVLLDWLAVDLIEGGWNLQRLHRQIVTSATYRQSARAAAGQLACDPDNRWLARAPRLRLDAEVVRDAALVASGKLSETRFGRPVRPPQPKDVTEIAFGRPGWRADRGEARFRRSIYTFQKRTAPFAFYATFDAPSGESCLVQRQRSRTPLQVLSLLNDPMMVELHEAFGQALAARAQRDGVGAALVHAFRRVCTRAPEDAELDRLRAFFDRQLERTDQKTAWAAVARALLCLEEAVTRS
ncbi:MAG: PSD1 and planctomycete cytochrome C domain-containing protein [Planctomycetota bacterium]